MNIDTGEKEKYMTWIRFTRIAEGWILNPVDMDIVG
jgi:hypothetical protein